jgi:hypothetical protein
MSYELVKEQLQNLRIIQKNLSDLLCDEILHKLSTLELSGSVTINGFLKSNGFDTESPYSRIFHSNYQNEIIKMTEANLRKKGYRTILKVDNRAIHYRSTIVDYKFRRQVQSTFVFLFLALMVHIGITYFSVVFTV